MHIKKLASLVITLTLLLGLVAPERANANGMIVKIIAGEALDQGVHAIADKAGVSLANQQSDDKYRAWIEEQLQTDYKEYDEADYDRNNRVKQAIFEMEEDIKNAPVTPNPEKEGWGKKVIKLASFATGAYLAYEGYNAFMGAYNGKKFVNGYTDAQMEGVVLTQYYNLTWGDYVTDSGRVYDELAYSVGTYSDVVNQFLGSYKWRTAPDDNGSLVSGANTSTAYVANIIKPGTTADIVPVLMFTAGTNNTPYYKRLQVPPSAETEVKDFRPIMVHEADVPKVTDVPALVPFDEAGYNFSTEEGAMNEIANIPEVAKQQYIEIDVPLETGVTYPTYDPVPNPDYDPTIERDPVTNPEFNPSPYQTPLKESELDPIKDPNFTPESEPVPEDNGTPTGETPPPPSSPDEVNWDKLKALGTLFTEKFPFSLPWDIQRALDATFGGFATGEIPVWNWDIKFWNSGFTIPITLPEITLNWFPFIRQVVLLTFDITLIYAVRKWFGGAS